MIKIYKRFVFTYIIILMGIASSFAQEDLNVLVFLVDDLRPDLACYGNELMHSPNIDKLAKDGVMFKNAYAQQAICAPSRMSILTGLRPETFAIYDIFTRYDKTHPDAMTLPSLFRDNGYKTVSIGKVFHHGLDNKSTWDIYHGKENNTYHIPGNDTLKPAFEAADVEDIGYKDGRAAQKAIEVLNQYKNDKFLMVLGLSKPHLPFNVPKKYWDLYDQSQFKIPLREEPINVYSSAVPGWGELRGYGNIPAEGYLDDDLSKDLINGYYASVSYIDAQVGKVMQTLDDLDLRKNTIVVLMSDHGWKLGEYGAWCKHSNFDIDINVPLIISRETSHPQRKTNVKTNAIVENVDIFPTLAEACGIPIPPRDGKSLLTLIDTPEMEWSKVAYSLYAHGEWRMGVTCTDGTYRYVEWRNFANNQLIDVELYPCKENYMERSVNLAELAQYDSIEANMKTLLHKHYPLNNRPYGQANMPAETIIDTVFHLGFENLTDGEIIKIGTDLTVEAIVGSAYTEVSLWLGDTNMGTLTPAPFKWVLSDLAEKSHKLKLVATGGEGIIATDSIEVKVVDVIYPNVIYFDAEQATSPAKNLVDGKASDASRWSAQVFPKSIVVDYGEAKSFTGSAVHPYQNRAYHFTIAISDSANSGFVTVVDQSGAVSELPIKNSFSATTGRYVKLTVTGATGYTSNWVSIQELEMFYEDIVNSITDANSVNNGINIYPNPATGVLYFKGANFINAKVFTLTGQMVKSVPVLKNQVDVSQLETGMYLIQLWGEKGQLYTGSFVKE